MVSIIFQAQGVYLYGRAEHPPNRRSLRVSSQNKLVATACHHIDVSGTNVVNYLMCIHLTLGMHAVTLMLGDFTISIFERYRREPHHRFLKVF